jgi:hypothetical protein
MDCCEVPRLQHDDNDDGIGRRTTITPPLPHRAHGPERWCANAVVRIIVVAIGQRALEIGKTTALVGQRVLFDGRRSIIVRKAVAQNHKGTHQTIVLEVKILSIDERWGNGIHFGRWGQSEEWPRC